MASATNKKRSLRRRLASVLKRPGNETCCDCSEQSPPWGAFITPPSDAPPGSQTLVAFLCLDCAGAHRSLDAQPSVLRNAKLEDWDESDIGYAEKSGNEAVNSIYEAKLHENPASEAMKISPAADDEEREVYVEMKYCNREFYSSIAHFKHVDQSDEPPKTPKSPGKRGSLLMFLHKGEDESGTKPKCDATLTTAPESFDSKNVFNQQLEVSPAQSRAKSVGQAPRMQRRSSIGPLFSAFGFGASPGKSPKNSPTLQSAKEQMEQGSTSFADPDKHMYRDPRRTAFNRSKGSLEFDMEDAEKPDSPDFGDTEPAPPDAEVEPSSEQRHSRRAKPKLVSAPVRSRVASNSRVGLYSQSRSRGRSSSRTRDGELGRRERSASATRDKAIPNQVEMGKKPSERSKGRTHGDRSIPNRSGRRRTRSSSRTRDSEAEQSRYSRTSRSSKGGKSGDADGSGKSKEKDDSKKKHSSRGRSRSSSRVRTNSDLLGTRSGSGNTSSSSLRDGGSKRTTRGRSHSRNRASRESDSVRDILEKSGSKSSKSRSSGREKEHSPKQAEQVKAVPSKGESTPSSRRTQEAKVEEMPLKDTLEKSGSKSSMSHSFRREKDHSPTQEVKEVPLKGLSTFLSGEVKKIPLKGESTPSRAKGGIDASEHSLSLGSVFSDRSGRKKTDEGGSQGGSSKSPSTEDGEESFQVLSSSDGGGRKTSAFPQERVKRSNSMEVLQRRRAQAGAGTGFEKAKRRMSRGKAAEMAEVRGSRKSDIFASLDREEEEAQVSAGPLMRGGPLRSKSGDATRGSLPFMARAAPRRTASTQVLPRSVAPRMEMSSNKLNYQPTPTKGPKMSALLAQAKQPPSKESG